MTQIQNFPEHSDTFSLSSMGNIDEATTKIVAFLGMFACERSGKVSADKTSHTIFLSVSLVWSEILSSLVL